MHNLKDIILPIATLAGMIIGVGFFSLPYITLKVGFPIILIYFLILGTIVTIIHLIFGKLAVKTPDFKRFPGFVKFYLGKQVEKIALTSSIFGGLGGLLVYLLVGSTFLENLLSSFLDIGTINYILIYFAIGSFFVFSGIKSIAKLSFWFLSFFFLVFIIMFNHFSPMIQTNNLFLGSASTIKDFFLPYGAILYSLWGVSLIPDIEEMLRRKKRLIGKTIFFATLIPILIYLCFVYLILGLTGVNTTEMALVGLESHIGAEIVNLLLILGILTTFTSYVSSGLVLKKVFMYDLKMKKGLAWAIACFVPLISLLAGMDNFIKIISLLGGVGLSLNGILILLMYKESINKEKGTNKKYFWFSPLILIFVLGIIYELIYFFS